MRFMDLIDSCPASTGHLQKANASICRMHWSVKRADMLYPQTNTRINLYYALANQIVGNMKTEMNKNAN